MIRSSSSLTSFATASWLMMAGAHGQNVVNGSLFTLSDSSTAPNGAWSWFEDERAIVDNSNPANPRLLVSSVSSAANGSQESGDIDLLWRDLGTGAQGEFEFINRLERDDHNSAALYVRPDGRYLAAYGTHGEDDFMRYRISTNPHDPTAWGSEQVFDASTNSDNATYNNLYYLPNDNGGAGRLYNFTRSNNWDPNVLTSNDSGSSWGYRGKLLTQGGGNDRPYLRYASDGERIHFIATEEHPRNFSNNVYHGYVQDGVLYNTQGDVIDASIFDSNGVSPTSLTRVFTNGSSSNATTMTRGWTVSMEIDNTGNPVAIFQARANDDRNDHRFFYARHDGADWQVNEMAAAGGYLYSSESDYTGLASIDPSNPNVVYMSSEVDPDTGNATSSGHYELFKGVTGDFGATWAWSAITEDSTMDNLRPLVPEWDGENTAVTWMRGTYSTFESWTTEVVGVNFAAEDARSQLWRGDAPGNVTTWNVNNAANWDSGGGTAVGFNHGDEVAFNDQAGSFQVNIAAPVSPNGVAFNNSTNDYTFTGDGIGGSGRFRVFGGGRVTLNNAANSYTGETVIARGTLALAGNATLSQTPRAYAYGLVILIR